MKKEKNAKKFSIFNFFNKDGKGVDKSEVTGPPNLKNFFKSFFRKFNKLLSLNLMMWFRIPMYLLMFGLVSYLLYGLGGIFETFFATTASLLGDPLSISSSTLLATLSGTYVASGSFSPDGQFIAGSGTASILSAIFGNVVEMPAYNATFFIVIIALFVFVLATWGLQSVGATYITRGLVRGDPVFMFSDYFHAIKKNYKQGIILGIIDALILLLLTFDLCFLYTNSTSFFTEVLLFINAGIFILYSFVRKYLYMLAITFDMKIPKIFKNALIFTVLGLKRNLVGAVGSILLLTLNVAIGILCMSFNFIIPLMLPLVYYIGASYYISAYSVYPVIDKYMIEPYKQAHPEEFESYDDEDFEESTDDTAESVD